MYLVYRRTTKTIKDCTEITVMSIIVAGISLRYLHALAWTFSFAFEFFSKQSFYKESSNS